MIGWRHHQIIVYSRVRLWTANSSCLRSYRIDLSASLGAEVGGAGRPSRCRTQVCHPPWPGEVCHGLSTPNGGCAMLGNGCLVRAVHQRRPSRFVKSHRIRLSPSRWYFSSWHNFKYLRWRILANGMSGDSEGILHIFHRDLSWKPWGVKNMVTDISRFSAYRWLVLNVHKWNCRSMRFCIYFVIN